MSFTDKTLTCVDCGASFVFTAGEQEFHSSKGFTNDPRRCVNCRRARKGLEPQQARPAREMFTVPCASCGKEARVPFEPRGDRPVYCSDCFQPQPRSFGGGDRGGHTGGFSSGGSANGGSYGGGFGGDFDRSYGGGGGRRDRDRDRGRDRRSERW